MPEPAALCRPGLRGWGDPTQHRLLGVVGTRVEADLRPRRAFWPHLQSIPVCWENASNADGVEESRRGVVRAAVAGSWESGAATYQEERPRTSGRECNVTWRSIVAIS